jgi:hypothetical protein
LSGAGFQKRLRQGDACRNFVIIHRFYRDVIVLLNVFYIRRYLFLGMGTDAKTEKEKEDIK